MKIDLEIKSRNEITARIQHTYTGEVVKVELFPYIIQKQGGLALVAKESFLFTDKDMQWLPINKGIQREVERLDKGCRASWGE